jgi:vacuolar-type H+-ATPase subunit I/STV1
MALQQQSQYPHAPSSASQNHRSPSQKPTASREAFLWRRKLELEEQAFDLIAQINALQDKLAMIEEQKKTLKQELTEIQDKLQKGDVLQYIPVVGFLARRPKPDLRLIEMQVRRLVEEEMKTKADLSLAQHSLDSLNAKVAYLDFELSLL